MIKKERIGWKQSIELSPAETHESEVENVIFWTDFQRLPSFPILQSSNQIIDKLIADATKYRNDEAESGIDLFYQSQRTTAENSGRLAGIETLRFVNEPTTTSSTGCKDTSDETIIVFDSGSRTMDMSIIRVTLLLY